jgi:hypothetical protein
MPSGSYCSAYTGNSRGVSTYLGLLILVDILALATSGTLTTALREDG